MTYFNDLEICWEYDSKQLFFIHLHESVLVPRYLQKTFNKFIIDNIYQLRISFFTNYFYRLLLIFEYLIYFFNNIIF